MLEKDTPRALEEAIRSLEGQFAALPEFSGAAAGPIAAVMGEVAARLGDNYPYFHPLYAGQMLKPPHPVARAAYALATWINPNNHALDGGRASSEMEREAVAQLAAMFGWREHLGHLTGGGTMANLEALWVAGQRHPGKAIVASEQAHYTHSRISAVLQLPFEAIRSDSFGRMDLNALAERAAKGDVGTVVATLGTTATGSVDPLPGILELAARHGFRVHVDAAYGGYFLLAGNLGENAQKSFARMGEADSVVIDPHKHGLQPYGCGCVLFRDPVVGTLYQHHSPFTYFSSPQLHLGQISLECSRPGAAAAALWATQKLLPLERGGELARGLERGREAALKFWRAIADTREFVAPFPPELDILVFIPVGTSPAEISLKSRRIYAAAARHGLHLAVAELPVRFWKGLGDGSGTVTCLRSVLMKPEHLDWIERILALLRLANAAEQT